MNIEVKKLLEKGFERVHDGGETYLEYIFNKDDYFNSKFLATETFIQPVEDAPHYLHIKKELKVINNVDPDNGEAYLTEEQIDELIKNGGY